MLLTNDQKKTIEEWVMENMKENLRQAIMPYIWGYGNKNGPELPKEIN